MGDNGVGMSCGVGGMNSSGVVKKVEDDDDQAYNKWICGCTLCVAATASMIFGLF
jgi:hypothetical protein